MKNETWIDEQLSKDLPAIRARGEGQEVEFKCEFPQQTTDLAKEIAAFATSNSGLILLGVENSGDLRGLENVATPEQRDALVSRLAGICTGSVKPAVTPRIRWAKEADCVILAISVPKGPEPVYYLTGRPYLRHLSDSRPAEPHEVVNLIRRHLATHGSDPDAENETPDSKLKSAIAGALNRLLIWEEIPEDIRHIKPALYEWRADCQGSSDDLRALAANDTAINLGLEDQLRDAADALDSLANFKLYIGCGDKLAKVEAKAYSLAKHLKDELIDSVPLAEGSKRQIKEVLVEQSRRLKDLAMRSETMVNEGRIDDVKDEVGRFGNLFAQIAFYRLEFISPDAVEVLRSLAVELRTLQYKGIQMDGGRSVNELVGRIKECAEVLAQFVITVS